MSAPKKFKSALKKLCDRAKSALNSQARISSPAVNSTCNYLFSNRNIRSTPSKISVNLLYFVARKTKKIIVTRTDYYG